MFRCHLEREAFRGCRGDREKQEKNEKEREEEKKGGKWFLGFGRKSQENVLCAKWEWLTTSLSRRV